MRRSRRGGSHGLEFGGSGEDSFVAVVVTKLTGALLFILLLTMVIMVLIPKAIDVPASPGKAGADAAKLEPLTITTTEALPEAIAGRPYTLALAASGGTGSRKWSLQGQLPEGLKFDPALGQISGMPTKGTPEPIKLALRVSDGTKSDTRAAQLAVFESETPLSLPSKWKPTLPPIPWKAWLDQGLGFLMIWMVHLLAMNLVRGMEDSSDLSSDVDPSGNPAIGRARARGRFLIYRTAIRLTTILATLGLTVWLLWPHLVSR